MNRRVCRRCLLKELDGEYFQSVYRYIESIPLEQKTPPEEYRRRLELCKACGQLQNGMCAQCGCCVEVRAVKKKMGCPVGNWSGIE